ncbi:hypothetical protein V8C42DRAFT_359352 [Trichoderma barbatum]
MPHRNSYTIGWVCAQSTVQIAAEEFLDEEHEAPDDIPATDPNRYTLGSIGKHYVVITVLPQDENKISSAASVTTNLLSNFPNIRIGLLVGIGGGVPSERHDIRLGDIVVGTGGVFQYDFEKTIQREAFQYIGSLNKPPTVLRTAVTALETQYRRRGHQLKEDIDDILKNKKRLQREFGRPEATSDRLFLSDVVHNPGGCASKCAQDESNLIIRHERLQDEEDDPAIHYGLIASANQLMRDASIRDKLSAEKDVLCFEVEEADCHFPCLVIRGVCDYSDSHNNKQWAGYAAMTAAAYIKVLIRQLHPSKVEAEQRLSGVIDETLDAMVCINTNIEDIQSQLQSEEDRMALDWLSDFDYISQHRNYLHRRQNGTGQWFLDSREYQTWLSTSKQQLLCPGKPGAGKTILTAIVIDDLHNRFINDSTIGIAYYYCSVKHQGQQTIEGLMESILKQLCACRPSVPDALKAPYSKYEYTNNNRRPTLRELLTALRAVLGTYSRVYIALDALDELHAVQRFSPLLRYLQVTAELSIFATSRPILEIEELFSKYQSVYILASQNDVYKYIDGRMSRLPAFVQDDTHLQEQIKWGIATNVRGMFLLAQLYMNSLQDKVTSREIKQALERMRLQGQKSERLEVLCEAYGDIVNIIRSQRGGFRRLAKQTIYWICRAKKQMTVKKLQYALAVDLEMDRGRVPKDIIDDNIPAIDLIVSTCCGLVTLDEDGKYIRLIHHTAQRYLDHISEKWFSDAGERITKMSPAMVTRK